MHKLGFQIPIKIGNTEQEHNVRKFQLHDSTTPSEIRAWVDQFKDGYFDIVYDDILNSPVISNCVRKNLMVLERYTYIQLITRQIIKAITWKKYSNILNQDGGNCCDTF